MANGLVKINLREIYSIYSKKQIDECQIQNRKQGIQ